MKGAIETLVIDYGKPKKIGNDTYPPLIDRTNFRSEYKFLLSEMKNYDCCDSETETIFKFWKHIKDSFPDAYRDCIRLFEWYVVLAILLSFHFILMFTVILLFPLDR